MSKRGLSPSAKNAVFIGVLCSIAYLAVYLARNILGAVTPFILEEGVFDENQTGALSSLFFIAYAIGQLINGVIGDKIKAKYMISAGLFLAGISNLVFGFCTHSFTTVYVAYGFTGFFLSMIYGPMTKVVSENTDPIYAPRCALGYTFSSFFGSPLAGILAATVVWQSVFSISSIALMLMGIICMAVFTVFEKKKIVQYGVYKPPKKSDGGIKILLKRKIVKFTFISIITGVVRTTVVFWLPTYISQHLGFSTTESSLLFTVATLFVSASAFVAIFVYELLGRKMELTVLLSFILATVFFILTYFVKLPYFNLVVIVLGIICSNAAATMMWSRYCPSLCDTGMVSSATGFLDFVSYMSASLSSSIFASLVTSAGWGVVILTWVALMLIATVISLPWARIRGKQDDFI